MNNNMEKEIFDIYVDDIIPNRFQPRLTFDDRSLNELADSIKQHGIIQPLVVRKVGDKYEIIAGERRYKASQIAGLQKVPAVIMNLDDKQSAEVAVIENIQRRDLTALEEAESYKKLLDKGYLTQEQLASRMGKAQATISNKLRLLGLSPEVKDALLNEKISERHARSLLSLKNPDDQKAALDKILIGKLTVKQTDELIKSMTGVTVPADSVETLDFGGTQTVVPPIIKPVTVPPVAPPPLEIPSFEGAEPPIKTPTVQVVMPVTEPVVGPVKPAVEEVQPSFAPISNIDVNQLKEAAVDINPVQPLADVNALLGINPGISPAPMIEPHKENESGRFINLEDEETNMDMGDISSTPSISSFGIPSTLPKIEEPASVVSNTVVEEPKVAVAQTTGPLPNPFADALEPSLAPVSENVASVAPIEAPSVAMPAPSAAPLPNPFANVLEPVEAPAPVQAPEASPTIAEPKTFTDSLVQEFRQVNNPTGSPMGVVQGDLRSAINGVRETTRLLERNNFKVDVEEFDFEKVYQIIIKIEK